MSEGQPKLPDEDFAVPTDLINYAASLITVTRDGHYKKLTDTGKRIAGFHYALMTATSHEDALSALNKAYVDEIISDPDYKIMLKLLETKR